ncbi:DUF11 domain-containing protein [Novosphingobium sp. B 225]|uniref:DUF11 domain-containing protein n=1 Tax=Novosphingobium sp. B 225 TaxID=1961849 RepID=UPI000B4BD8E8|nr:DUF11 domain-containing protein [Novosphingobium sp. B 225]
MVALRNLGIYLVALLLAVLLIAVPGAQAQTITNVAAANWTDGGKAFSVNSNTVSFDLQQQPITIDTFVGGSGNGNQLAFNPSACGGQTIVVPGGLPGGSSVASLQQTSTIRIGNTLFFRLVSPGSNADPTKIDTVRTILTTTSGDREEITISETAVNSGVFIGAIPTTAIPPKPVQGDCRLSVSPGDHISIECLRTGGFSILATAQVEILADPFGLFFDSEDGTPIDGVRVTLVDAATGAPARVFADDGVTPWPSTVVSGASVTDGAGNVWPMLPGEYRFPLAALGQYRLVVTPPAPYSAPSKASPGQLALLRRPDGAPLEIVPGSFGGTITLNSPAAVRVDVPLDRPAVAVSLTKFVSKPTALPGEVVFYTVTARNPDSARTKRAVSLVDTPSALLRLRKDSVRLDGAANPAAVQASADGRQLTVALGDIGPGASKTVTYAMTVRADAPAGQAVNKAVATDSRGLSSVASAVLKISQDNLGARMTLIGQITDGGCAIEGQHIGIPGVRVVLEDGSFAITDADGRYHFDGLTPGSHVVQALTNTLPKGGQFVDCARSTRSAGSASSRFIMGQGGSLAVADFSATLPYKQVVKSSEEIKKSKDDADVSDSRIAAGAETNWLTQGDGPIDFLFPALDHNPRAPAVRVVIRHRPGQKVELSVDGKPVDKVAFDGLHTAPAGTHAVSVWRAIPIFGETTHLTAVVRNADGSVAANLTRDVHYADAPAQVEWLPAQSKLTADGSTRPVLAIRVLDRNGRPVHDGISGEFTLGAPYESAEAQDAMQSRALTGLGRAAPRWTVKGDQGVALVELAPTMVSGKLHMEFTFTHDQQRRRQQLDAWVVPGEQPWTLVGLAEGSVGARSVADNMERTGRLDSDLGQHARVAFYAKGRVLGKFLLTAAYDSAKQRDDQRLLGAIDPRAYYTVFADGSERRFDAASREKLYVRVESSIFYALYGDFDTGFDQTQLARYQRTATGFKGELNTGGFHAQAFAAKIAASHRRDEIQGGGISGPYRLSSRAIVPNSEQVSIEVRDRFRSEVLVDRRSLTRFIDYDIDLLSGTITFKEPVLSRDVDLNPQFIVVDYEIDETARGGAINAGLRADYTTANGKLRLGASAITDTGSGGADATRTNLGAVDLRAKLGENTEVRAELGMSFSKGEQAKAWLIEAERHDGKLDLLAYARSADKDYGVGQLSGAERGRRKYGVDARYQLSEPVSLTASTWYEDSLTDTSHRFATQVGALYRTPKTDARLGVAMMRDHLADGTDANSTVLEGGVTQRMAGNRLELGIASSIALGKAESVDLPERHRLTARYTLSPAVKLVGTYEIAKGESIDARTARAGLELTPWDGARVVTAAGQQQIGELGKRSFAAFGLAQSFNVTKDLTIDATLDGSKTLGGIDAAKLINPQHPASSGGNLGEDGTLAEDFTAMTLGATWRTGRWSASMRGELRNGQLADRKGFTFGAIRQLGEGSMVGSGFTWTRATGANGLASEIFDGAIAAAHRPSRSPFAFLSKLEFRSDSVSHAVAGEAGPAGRTALTVDGDARSRRLIGAVSANWSPRGKQDGQFVQRTELGLFAAVRHNFDGYQDFNLAGTTLIGGLDARLGLGEHFDLGAVATVRHNLDDKTTSFAFGPQIGISPAKDVLLTVGYNITGFRDRDFSAARSTDKGLFATLRMKVDADTFGFLGLRR